MPQGGIDEGEDPYPAALRELYEETNIHSVEKLGEIEDWLTYDIPREDRGKAWKGKYRGQKQKWYALRFTGDESEIDIEHPAGGHEPEFIDWRWEPMRDLPDLIVPFKREIYEQVVQGVREIHLKAVKARRRGPSSAASASPCLAGAGRVLEVIEPRDLAVERRARLRVFTRSSSSSSICACDAARSTSSTGVGDVGEHGQAVRSDTSAKPPSTTSSGLSPPA